MQRVILPNFKFIFMFKFKTIKSSVLTFKRFSYKPYAVFCSLKREIRIASLSVATLMVSHNAALASRSDSLQIIHQNQPEGELDEVVVSGRSPVTLELSATKVEIITRDDIEKAKVQTVNDLLKLCASVDVRQRGAFGVQTDIGIGGGTHEQVCILINGINVNNPQTGHLTADFPVAIQDIERIEVYDGATARCFGSQALNGAINIITHCEKHKEANFHAAGGSYGSAMVGAAANLTTSSFSNRLSADYMRSDGATHNSEFQKIHTFYQGRYDTDPLALDWQAGYSYQRYGANTFYSANYPDQWERNNRFLASVKGHSKQGRLHIDPLLSWVRSYDHFQLIRGTHTGENFHRNDVFTSALNSYVNWAGGRTAFGGELRYEGILSTNLGKPLDEQQYVKIEGHDGLFYNKRDHRNNVSFFLEHCAFISDFTLSFGAMANRNTSVDDKFHFYPGIDVSYRGVRNLKLYASYNQSMRLPTFTDLYYKSPTQEGNIGLKPEKTATVKIGAEYKLKGFRSSLQGIYRHGEDMIDWVMYNSSDIYHSAQFKLDNYEILFQAKTDFRQMLQIRPIVTSVDVSYMYNYQKRFDDIEIYKSNYALEYLRNKLSVCLTHTVWKSLSASWYWLWQERMGGYMYKDNGGNVILRNYSPYSLVNVKFNWTKPRYTLYLSLDNLTNHTYYDYGNIPQHGFTFLAGANIKFNFK